MTAAVGTALSLVVAVLAYAFGVSADASFLGGLMGICISLQADSMLGSSALRSDLVEVGEITDTILRNQPFIPPILATLRALDRVSRHDKDRGDPTVSFVLTERASQMLVACHNDMSLLAQGSFRTSASDVQPLNVVLPFAKKSLRGIAVHGLDRLNYDHGRIAGAQKYTDLQRALLHRGVSVERIFVYDSRTTEVKRAMGEQLALGVSVFEIAASEAPENLIVDCVLVDDNFYGKLEVGSAGSIVGTMYSVNPAEVATRIRAFEELKSLARGPLR